MDGVKLPNYDGNIYPPEQGRIAGWLADLNALHRTVECEILLDGQSLGVVRADQSRPSLRRRGLGDGRYGFEMMVTDRPLEESSRIAVRPVSEELPVLHRNSGESRAVTSPAASTDVGKIVALAAELDEDSLVKLIAGLNQSLLKQRIRTRFRAREWPEMNRLTQTLLSNGTFDPAFLCMLGRSALYERNFETARLCLALAELLDPDSEEILFYRGVTESRSGRYDEALQILQEATKGHPDNTLILAELCNALRFKLARQAGDTALIAETAACCRKLLAMDPGRRSAEICGQALLQAGMPAEALSAVEAALPSHPDNVELLHIKSRALVSLNRVAEALEVADQVLRLAPNNQTANFQKRTLSDIASNGDDARPQVFGRLDLPPRSNAGEDADEDLAAALARRSEDWLALTATGARDPFVGLDPAWLDRLVDPFLGHQIIEAGEGPIDLWRRRVLALLLQAGLVGPALEGLDRFRTLYGPAAGPNSPPCKPGRVVVMSRHGAFKFGGGEHFIESMAEHYQTRGYVPIIVGTRPEFVGQSGTTDAGFRYVFIRNNPAELLRLLVEEDVSLVHAISGSGFLAAEAVESSNIRLIYGIHYWREFLGGEGDFFAPDGTPNPRPDFRYILTRASTVYTNSDFTRQLLEQTFGVRAPVIYSVPADAVPLPDRIGEPHP